MKRKTQLVVTRNAKELSKALGLDKAHAIEWDFRMQLIKKIIEVQNSRGLTHAVTAKIAKTSRTRVTAIVNGNTTGVSTDLLLRIVYALGYKTKVTFVQSKIAA